jgi:hypothetical protein
VSPPTAERIDFTLERGRHRRFVGREDVLARVDEWLLGPDDAGWVVITGGPGMGKSALLSKWLDRREAAGAAVPHHFVRRQVIDWDQPERIAASLAAQIEAMFPAQRDDRARPEGRLPKLLGRVSKHLGASGRLVIVVDGLDETRAEPGENPLPRSWDKTLKVWDLQAGACLLTHRGDAGYTAVATTATAIIAGDPAGAVWFLDWPSPDVRQGSAREDRRHDNQPNPFSNPEPPVQRPPMKHTILFLAANPLGTDRVALDREARAIQVELERSGFRDRFGLVTRWAAEPLDLLRELRKLKPTVVHFSGHGTAGVAGHAPGPVPRRDIDVEPGHSGRDPRAGLFFQGPDGGPQLVSTEALEATFGAAGSSVQLIVLSACYSELNARALLRHVGCVVGIDGAIADDAARSFAIGFYGGLGERESIAAAYAQGCAAIRLQGLSDRDRPRLAVRAGIDAGKLVLAGAMDSPHVGSKTDQTQPRREPYVGPPQTGETRMTPDDLFNLLSKLLPAQFEAVLFRARVPVEYLPAATAPQAERAIATIRYFESQSRLDQLARAVQQVVPGGGFGTDPR